jgi:hypothetical protein
VCDEVHYVLRVVFRYRLLQRGVVKTRIAGRLRAMANIRFSLSFVFLDYRNGLRGEIIIHRAEMQAKNKKISKKTLDIE